MSMHLRPVSSQKLALRILQIFCFLEYFYSAFFSAELIKHTYRHPEADVELQVPTGCRTMALCVQYINPCQIKPHPIKAFLECENVSC